jgi:hypothetical protein
MINTEKEYNDAYADTTRSLIEFEGSLKVVNDFLARGNFGHCLQAPGNQKEAIAGRDQLKVLSEKLPELLGRVNLILDYALANYNQPR